jgi:hypothetical protein
MARVHEGFYNQDIILEIKTYPPAPRFFSCFEDKVKAGNFTKFWVGN